MPTYDFECCSCKAPFGDVFLSISELNRRRYGCGSWWYHIECPQCGDDRKKQSFKDPDRNFIDGQNPAMYGTGHEGKYHPGLGERVTSYDHKRKLLKEQGVVEAADPIGGSRSVLGDSDKIEQHAHSPGAKKRENEERKERAEDRERQGFGWA